MHPNQKRVINELKKVINESNISDDIKVFPLKDRTDVWRVLIKGFEDSLHKDFWFYLVIEFSSEYRQHCYLFRFHPNITDKGRVCIDTLDKWYRSDKSVLELSGEIRYLLRWFEKQQGKIGTIQRSLSIFMEYLHENGILHRNLNPENIVAWSISLSKNGRD